ncbi:unnamed protein product [Nippostrongylus brasiliensis]|uniref:NET domain-containing protein n=1 Tax=Nippostrongylus brasiliensis TaxID=27835 RepID=A0A0N4Y2T4_NIPBR|nr:hypothetical protein Q1695_011958 [Nippostrongylus brasiliensis]VDL73643.1 unnamed protein product [Nippostrongylus brasiliensis]
MTAEEELRFQKEIDQIEAELGDDHLVEMLQCLTSNSPEATEGLVKLHTQCTKVISKYPPMAAHKDKPGQKRTQSQGFLKCDESTLTMVRAHKVQTEKPRIMMTKRTNSMVPLKIHNNVAA